VDIPDRAMAHELGIQQRSDLLGGATGDGSRGVVDDGSIACHGGVLSLEARSLSGR
jgi:hypothetical protein